MREAKLTIILGTNGTGKTTLLRNLLEKINRRKLVITPDFTEWPDYPIIKRKQLKTFQNKARIIYQPGDFQGLRKIVFSNSILVLDDFRLFDLQGKAERDALRYLVGRRRQLGLDVFIVAHGFTEIIPTYLLTFANTFILFKTLDNPARVKNRFLDFDLIKQAQERVNKNSDAHFFEVINVR